MKPQAAEARLDQECLAVGAADRRPVYFAQTSSSGFMQNPTMSLAHWYHQKAAQCAQLAKDASDPRRRAALKSERKLWLQLAANIEKDDLLRFGPEPGIRRGG